MLPTLVCATGAASTLAGLRVLPSELAEGPDPQAHVQGVRPIHSTGEGCLLPTATPSVSLAFHPIFARSERKTAMESRSLLFRASWQELRPLREDPLVEGWTDAWRGGEAPLVRPESGIEDRRILGNNIISPRPWGNTANTIQNNPVGQAEGHRGQETAWGPSHAHRQPGAGFSPAVPDF